jgi:nucleoside-triphosphatase THEP1
VKKILIYTGPVQSGKSSRLLAFVQGRKDIGGILSLLIEGKKYLYDIVTGEKKLLETDLFDKEIDAIVVGRCKFKKKVFEWGREVLEKASSKNHTYLIIDEIGPLEFEGKGLSPIADEILIKNISSISQVIVVVRDTLVSQFLEHNKLNPEDIEFFKFD